MQSRQAVIIRLGAYIKCGNVTNEPTGAAAFAATKPKHEC